MSVCRDGIRILVPIDGSEHSERALETATEIAEKFKGKITLIHVVPRLAQFPMTTHSTELFTPALKELGKTGSELLAKAKRKVEKKNVKVETLFKGGHVVEQILKACKEGEFDLMVMGARGISSVKELILGSVSHGVLKHASIPVLVIR